MDPRFSIHHGERTFSIRGELDIATVGLDGGDRAGSELVGGEHIGPGHDPTVALM